MPESMYMLQLGHAIILFKNGAPIPTGFTRATRSCHIILVHSRSYLIKHQECGVVLFLTDTVYSPFVFKGLNNIIVEANYCDEILEEKRQAGYTIEMLRDRVIESHMSLKNCKDLLAANDLSQVNNIVLIHLSDSHSHETRFKKEVEALTGKVVHVADKGMVIENFEKTPF